MDEKGMGVLGVRIPTPFPFGLEANTEKKSRESILES